MRRGKTVVWMVIGLAAVTLTLILTIAIIAQVVFGDYVKCFDGFYETTIHNMTFESHICIYIYICEVRTDV